MGACGHCTVMAFVRADSKISASYNFVEIEILVYKQEGGF